MKTVGMSRLYLSSALLMLVFLLTSACAMVPTPTPAPVSPALVQPVNASIDTQAVVQSPAPPKPTNGKPQLIEFYASWCAPCVQMKPVVSRLKDEYGDRVDFKIYDVAGSQEEKKIYKYMGQPQYDIVDRNGEILFIRNGYQNYDSLKADLETVLAKR